MAKLTHTPENFELYMIEIGMWKRVNGNLTECSHHYISKEDLKNGYNRFLETGPKTKYVPTSW